MTLNYLKFNKHLKFLDLQYCNIDLSDNNKITFENFRTVLPSAIGINLKLFKNEYINSLTHVQFLNISYCNINILPKELFHLQLKLIDCSNNEITEIPAEIGNCKKLEKFNCSFNKVAVIPSDICKLINLQNYYCNNNQITKISIEN